jgi:4-hydroxybutyryl-CoA dehydratase/vinylacetyl-CoA-Delta-isomerase
MKTGTEYRQSLNDGRATYFEGRRIDDLLGHPLLGQSVDLVARGYDRWYAPGEAARNPLMTIPRSADDLRARIPMQHGADIVALVTYQAVMTLTTAAGRIDQALPRYADRIRDYVDCAQRDDIRITECITDAKGDRSLPPSKQDDPDAYTRVVERSSDGIVIRGAKLHITGASLGHGRRDPHQSDEARRRGIRGRLCRTGERDW